MERDASSAPAAIVIFGITGDLARRKLLPALLRLHLDGLLPSGTRIIGVTRQKLTKTALLSGFEKSLGKEAGRGFKAFAKNFEIFSMNVSEQPEYMRLKYRLDAIDRKDSITRQRLFYLSVPPAVFDEVVALMGGAGLNKAYGRPVRRPSLLIEKPFGFDLKSASYLIKTTKKYFKESQLYRIDHYLAKEMAQNILDFRFYNPVFNGIWNHNHISRVEITAHERAGIEGRATFYEQTGALRDLIQSHLLQLMNLVAMEKPRSIYDGASIHKKRLQLFDDVIVPAENEIDEVVWRGQYASYKTEIGKSHSNTETYAQLKLFIDNERWQNVPFILKTGKATHEKRTVIEVFFGKDQANKLEFRLQPHEGIGLSLRVKRPGHTHDQSEAALDLHYARDFPGQVVPEAYERVLLDALRQDQTLFASSEEVLASWRIVQPVLSAWSMDDSSLHLYHDNAPEIAPEF